MSHAIRIVLLAGLAVALGACQTTLKTSNDFTPPQGLIKVLLMPPDVQLSEMQASGLQEPRADWTEMARANIKAALARRLQERNSKLVEYVPPGDLAEEKVHNRLINLHNAVGNAVRVHKLLQPYQLPTKEGRFDWTLGPNVARLREAYGADYALFYFVRDSYASAGRAAVMVAFALLGAAVPGGRQDGYVSLVDLRSGEIVWFNVVLGQGGDLRQSGQTQEAVKGLLADMPI